MSLISTFPQCTVSRDARAWLIEGEKKRRDESKTARELLLIV